jgi:hypothetical protein
MLLLLLTVILDQWINDFSTHQAPPARHPNLATCGHIHKMVDYHRSLTSGALHRSNLLQQVMCVSIGGGIPDLKPHTQEKDAYSQGENMQKCRTSTKQYPENDNSLPCILPPIHQDFSDKAGTVLTNSSFSRK